MSPPFASGERYHLLSEHYRRRFGCKVHKVSVSTAQTCPNRQGAGGAAVCTFCDPWGSAAYHELVGAPLATQIRTTREQLRRRYKAEKFLVYFQAYTNTFGRVSRLEQWLHQALAERDVVGVVVGTRPDCLPTGTLQMLGDLSRSHYVSVELGLQTLDDGQLRFLSRGHDRACSLAALDRLAAHPAIEVCAHLMFGLPGETEAQLRGTAAELSARGLQGVKLHNLHVLRGTPLEGLYRAGRFRPVSLPRYARKVRIFLEHLAPAVAVHRLSAVATRWEELVAPAWVRGKMGPTQFIRDHLAGVDSWQGKHYQSPHPGAARRPAAPSGHPENGLPAQPGNG